MKVKSVTIKIETTNAAFDGANYTDEMARVLRELGTQASIGRMAQDQDVLDSNGNTVGSVSIEWDNEDKQAA